MQGKAAVIGGGSWGTGLAIQLHRNDYQVWMQDINEERVAEINQEHKNSYLPGIDLPADIKATTKVAEAVRGAELVVVVVPSHVVRQAAENLQGLIAEEAIVVSAAKGMEVETQLRMSEVLREELDDKLKERIVVLSGPSHAEEVVLNHPTAVVVAHEREKLARQVQDVFMSETFRVYTNPDVVGVELGATVKNIIAIAAGIADGLDYGDNAIAALVTRGIAEIKRLGVAMGANSMTFAGLTGLGDLIVTCTSEHSRNRRLGYKLGAGKTLEEALEEMDMVAEGVKSTQAIFELVQQKEVEMPIVTQVQQILFQDKSPERAVNNLMLRGRKNEIESVAQQEEW